MRAASMFFSVLQIPRCRVVASANICLETFSGSRTCKIICPFRHMDRRVYGIGEHNRGWPSRPITTKGEGKESTFGGKQSIWPRIPEELVASTKLDINRTEGKEVQEFQYSGIQEKIAEDTELAKLVTFIIIDIETTGFNREEGRIIEIALQDLKGGRNSTFQTLVNPQCHITNSYVHGIITDMVNRPDVPRMEELIPILLQYIRSRQAPGGKVVLVAHNGRAFDIPFLISEFKRCGYEIPSDWLFLDTLPLGREARKLAGSKGKASLQALREDYGFPLIGSAHRAMSDVQSLALIFQRLTFDLKLSVSQLLQKCFRASDVGTSLKKKKKKKKNPSL